MANERARRLEAAMADLRPERVEGEWHRFVAELYKNDPLSHHGALEHGGRYNPRREFGALYLSESRAACQAEMSRRPAVRVRYWHAHVNVRLVRVLDLTDPATRQKLGLVKEGLISNDWDLTQDVGRAARRAGFHALIVPSTAGEHRNLVVFKDLLIEGETVQKGAVAEAP